MSYLLDTQLALWATYTPTRLPVAAKAIFTGPLSVSFSVINLWEIAIKSSLRRADFPFNARMMRRALLDADCTELPILSEHAFGVADLPRIHGDPFDRLLIAQARSEGLTLLTTDATIAKYGDNIQRV